MLNQNSVAAQQSKILRDAKGNASMDKWKKFIGEGANGIKDERMLRNAAIFADNIVNYSQRKASLFDNTAGDPTPTVDTSTMGIS